MAKRTRYSLDFKRRVVQQMRTCENVKTLSRELKVNRSLLYHWKGQLEGRPPKGRLDLSQTRQSSVEQKLRQENRLLKEALGQKALETDFFAAALRRIEEQRRNSTESGGPASTSKSARGSSKRKAD